EVKESEIRSGVQLLAAAAEEPAQPGALAQPPMRPMDPIVADNHRRYIANTRLGMSVAGLVVALIACSGFYAWWSRPAEAAVAKLRALPPVADPHAVSQAVQPVAANPETPQVIAETESHTTVDGIDHVVLNLSATE